MLTYCNWTWKDFNVFFFSKTLLKIWYYDKLGLRSFFPKHKKLIKIYTTLLDFISTWLKSFFCSYTIQNQNSRPKKRTLCFGYRIEFCQLQDLYGINAQKINSPAMINEH